jgi:hypothetical protein
VALLELKISLSLPFRDGEGQADRQAIDRLVRELTISLPPGALLRPDARRTLEARHPSATGELSGELSGAEDFDSAFELLCAHAPSGAGVRLGAFDGERAVWVRERAASQVEPDPRPRRPEDLLYR